MRGNEIAQEALELCRCDAIALIGIELLKLLEYQNSNQWTHGELIGRKPGGKSVFKHAALQFFPRVCRDVLRMIMPLMWLRRLVPQNSTHCLLALIPNPN